ncbi:MAG: phage tail protein [Eubacteriales bacterium]|nr:phage tail protein [Eubacteriales bacterium]
MYTVTCDGKILMDFKRHIVLTNPVLQVAENAAGSFQFDIAPDHPLYDEIEMMVSEIIVYADDVEIWSGRPVEQHTSFLGMRSIYCEGALAYLCDTIQEPSETHDDSAYNVQNWFTARLNNHNSKAPDKRKFYTGTVSVVEPDTLFRYTNYENTLECINEKLIKRLGGHLRIRRRSAGGFFLDYLADYPRTSEQTIRFGLNLLEYSKTLTRADIATVCLPLGAKQEEKDFAALEKYLDIKSVNNNSPYVESAEGVATFGRIIKVVHWDDVATAQNLKTKAVAWLNDAQYDDLKLEVNALDFHLADDSVPAIQLLDMVRVVSPPHGLDKYYPVTELKIPLDNPAGAVFTLGTSDRVSLTTKTNSSLTALNDDLETIPSAVLLQAKKAASDMIKSGEFGGHIVVLPNELYITDNEDINAAKNIWCWNMGGLGFSSTGKNGEYGTAITMDGKIVADYITAGLLSADRMRGGTLRLGGTAYKNGSLKVYNSSGIEIGSWGVNGIKVSAGRIEGGTIQGATINVGGSNNSEGTLTIHNTSSKVIGSWTKDGITVSSGSINGASIIAGGTANGQITIKDASDNTIGSWNKNGISVSKGTISGGTIDGATIRAGGSNNKSGLIIVKNEKDVECGRWDSGGITVKKGSITGTTISGNTISGNTITGGTIEGTTVKAGGDRNGSIYVYDSGGVEIGHWNKSGISVKSGSITGGSINGAAITVGGKNNGSGTIVVKDADGNTAVSLGQAGVTIKKGSITIGSKFSVAADGTLNAVSGTFKGTVTSSTISGGTVLGATIKAGGSATKSGKNGVIQIYDKDDKLIGKWDKSGITVNSGTISGSTIKGGTIVLGGSKNGDGQLTVKNATGTPIVTLNNSGVTVKSGTIQGTTISGGTISGTTISGGTIAIGNGDVFKVTSAGKLTCENAELTGKITTRGAFGTSDSTKYARMDAGEISIGLNNTRVGRIYFDTETIGSNLWGNAMMIQTGTLSIDNVTRIVVDTGIDTSDPLDSIEYAYVGATQNITINGTTYRFRKGLLVESA